MVTDGVSSSSRLYWEHSECWFFLIHLVLPHLVPYSGTILSLITFPLFPPNSLQIQDVCLLQHENLFSLSICSLTAIAYVHECCPFHRRLGILSLNVIALYFLFCLFIFAVSWHHWTWILNLSYWVQWAKERKKNLSHLNFKNAILPTT